MNNDILATLNSLSDADLLARAKALAIRERETTAQLVAHLAVLDTRDAFLREGYPSLFVYCRGALGLSDGEAYNRIEVARAVRRFPLILEMLAAGEIYLWSVRLLAPHLTPDNHAEVLASACGKKGKLTIQEIVARLAPRPDVPTSIRRIPAPPPEPTPLSPARPGTDEPMPISAAAFHPPMAAARPIPVTRAAVTSLSPDRYKFQLTISGDMLDKLRLAKDMISHAIPSGDDAAVLDRALTALLVDLAKKRFADRRPRKSRGCADESDIPAAVKRVVGTGPGAVYVRGARWAPLRGAKIHPVPSSRRQGPGRQGDGRPHHPALPRAQRLRGAAVVWKATAKRRGGTGQGGSGGLRAAARELVPQQVDDRLLRKAGRGLSSPGDWLVGRQSQHPVSRAIFETDTN
jgi:hypothetical protein